MQKGIQAKLDYSIWNNTKQEKQKKKIWSVKSILQGLHISGEALNAASNMILKYYTNESYSIEATNYPLPRNTKSQVSEPQASGSHGNNFAEKVELDNMRALSSNTCML